MAKVNCEKRPSLDERLTRFNHLIESSVRQSQQEGVNENETFIRQISPYTGSDSPTFIGNGVPVARRNIKSTGHSGHKKSMKSGGNCPRKCPIPECSEIFLQDNQIRTHLTNIHALKANFFLDFEFANKDDFFKWKAKLENDVGVWYKKVSTYNRKDGVKVCGLKCQSGEVRQGVLKEQVERFCPSTILLYTRDSALTVTGKYYPTHYGHYCRNASIETLREANIRIIDNFQPLPVQLVTHQPETVAYQPPPLLPIQTNSSNSVVTVPPREPPPLVAIQLPHERFSSLVNQSSRATSEDVLNLSVNRGNNSSSIVSEAQSTVPPAEIAVARKSNIETCRKLFNIKSSSELRLAVHRSEVSVYDAMEWIRYSFLSGDVIDDYKVYEKYCEQIRQNQRIWMDRLESGISGDGVTSASALLTKLSQLEDDNPIISEETVDDDDLEQNEEHYLIVIMNSIQVKMLKECGDCGIVSVDIQLEGTGEGALNMMSLIVIDAIGEPFPCAICISDIANISVARRFFSIVKSKTGNINVRIFICGDEVYHEHWKSIMTGAQNVFLASWLVDYSWRQFIVGLSLSVDEQLALFTALRSLMEISSVNSFQAKVETMITDVLHKHNLQPSSFLLNKSRRWASCHRHLEVRNCDMRLELQHYEFLAFKSISNEKNGNRSLLILIQTILDVIRRKCCERLTKLDIFVTPRAAVLQTLHYDSFQCDVLEIQSLSCDSKWLIKTRENSCYVWKSGFPICHHCKLRCDDCNICIHNFMCTCLDNLVSYNMCVHLHIIATHIAKSIDTSREVKPFGNCDDCEDCRVERQATENLRAEIITRTSIMIETLRTMTDLETLTVVKDSLVALQSMINTASHVSNE